MVNSDLWVGVGQYPWCGPKRYNLGVPSFWQGCLKVPRARKLVGSQHFGALEPEEPETDLVTLVGPTTNYPW